MKTAAIIIIVAILAFLVIGPIIGAAISLATTFAIPILAAGGGYYIGKTRGRKELPSRRPGMLP